MKTIKNLEVIQTANGLLYINGKGGLSIPKGNTLDRPSYLSLSSIDLSTELSSSVANNRKYKFLIPDSQVLDTARLTLGSSRYNNEIGNHTFEVFSYFDDPLTCDAFAIEIDPVEGLYAQPGKWVNLKTPLPPSTLTVSGGGTGNTSLLSNAILLGNGTSAITNINVPMLADTYLKWDGTSYTWATISNTGSNSGFDIFNFDEDLWDLGVQGTVTNIATGGGLIGGPITNSGTISLNITGQTLGTPLPGDELIYWDTVSSSFKKTLISSIGSGSGSVTNIATGGGLTGGPITSTGTVALDITGQTPGTITGTDELIYWNGSAFRKTTASALAGNDITGQQVLLSQSTNITFYSFDTTIYNCANIDILVQRFPLGYISAKYEILSDGVTIQSSNTLQNINDPEVTFSTNLSGTLCNITYSTPDTGTQFGFDLQNYDAELWDLNYVDGTIKYRVRLL